MFINNKYTNCYISLIAQAQARELPAGTYTEKHHIIPKCMGGADTSDNLVKLTAKEHYIAHLLLTRMTEGTNQQKMCFALWRMMHDPKKRNSRHIVSASQYEKIKIKMAEELSVYNTQYNLMHNAGERLKEWTAQNGPWNKGKKMPPEFGEAVRKRRTGSKASADTSLKISNGVKMANQHRTTNTGQTSPLKGRKIPRYTSVVEDTITGEQFVVSHLANWLAERGHKPNAIERGFCTYIVVKRFVTRTGEEVPIKRK